MAGALACGPALGDRETDRGAKRDPVGVFAHDVVAVDQIDRKNLVGPVTHTGLESGPDPTWNIGLARVAIGLDGPLQGVGELPVKADAVGEIMPVDGAVPQPAAVEID